MTTATTTTGRGSAFPAPILALALAAFAIDTTEFVIVGLLPSVAQDLGVSLPRAGLLVTGYALGVALGAPPLAALTGRARPAHALAALMVLFIAGNVLCALAPSYGWLMAGRIVASLTHGAFFGLGAAVAAQLVAPERRSAAIALMFSGLTLANVLGVPGGSWVGQLAGWRATFWSVSALGAIALMALLLLVPQAIRPVSGDATGAGGWSILLRPRLVGALALTALGFGGIFTTLTYLSPLLRDHAGLGPAQIHGALLLFGLGLTAGNLVGGWAFDRWKSRAMLVMLLLLAASEMLLHAVIASAAAATFAIVLWGMAAFALAPGLQSRVLEEAPDAPALASTLNIGAFNLGNAVAAWAGALAIDAGASLKQLPVLSALAAVGAAVLLVVLSRGRRKPA